MRKPKEEAIAQELERLSMMTVYEQKYYDMGCMNIAGIDEVGRGPLCGPVAAACVVLPRGLLIPYLNDSKKLSQKRREELYDVILEKAVAFSYALVEPAVIDEINILNATKLAMRLSLEKLETIPDTVLVDAVTIPDIRISQEAIIKGDEKSVSIAAASIIAKVTRDRIMDEASEIYPEYAFSNNKGYGTSEHIAAIKKHGLTPLHRISFCKKYIN